MQYQQLNNSQDNEEKEKEIEKDQCMICLEYFAKVLLKDHQSKCTNFSDDRLMEEYKYYNEKTSEPESQFFSVIKIQDQNKNTTQKQSSLNFVQPKIGAMDLLQSVKNNIQKQLIQIESPLQNQKNQQNIQQIEQNQQIIQEFNNQEEQLIQNEIQPQNQQNEQKIPQEQKQQIIIQEVISQKNLYQVKAKSDLQINYQDYQRSLNKLNSYKNNNFLPNYVGQNQNQIKKNDNEQPIKSEQPINQLNRIQEVIKLQEMKQEKQKKEQNILFQSLNKKNEKNNQDYQRHSYTPNKMIQQQSETERELKKQQNQQSNNKEKTVSFTQQSQTKNPLLQKEQNKKDEKNQSQNWKPRQFQQPIPRQKKIVEEDQQFQPKTPIQKKKFEYKPGMRLTDKEVEKLTAEEIYEYFTQLDLEQQVGFQSKIYLIDKKKIQINENKQCSVCLEDIQPSKEPIDIKLDCQHYFHYDCIKQWLQLHKNCPLCKDEVELVQ